MLVYHIINIFMMALIIFLATIIYDYSTENRKAYTLKALLDMLEVYVVFVILTSLVYGLIYVVADIIVHFNLTII